MKIGFAVTAVIAVIATGCGSSGGGTTATVNSVRVELAIAASVHAQRGVAAKVTCPTGIPLAAHRRFHCVAAVGSRDTPFLVTERDAVGHVSYVGVSPSSTRLLDTNMIARAIQRSVRNQRALSATVLCPSDIPQQRGLRFVCIATIPGRRATDFDVQQTDSSGHVSYRAR